MFRDQLHGNGVRFRIYGYNAAGEAVAELSARNSAIDWCVHVANKKAAWYQFQIAFDIPEAAQADPSQRRNAQFTGANRQQLVIDPGPRWIHGTNARGSNYRFDSGKFVGKSVYLGELRTDDEGRLTFLGGRGVSDSFDGSIATDFANSDGWHDDTSDGPATATVLVKGRAIPCDPAWVVTAPPTYANVSVWGSPQPAAADFVFDRNGHGWQLDRLGFEQLPREATSCAGVNLFTGTRLVRAVRAEAGTWTVTLENAAGEVMLTAGFLVDATGRRSALARMLGARCHAADQLVCRFARIRAADLASDRDSRTWIEAVASGWWYSALTPGGNRVVAFLTDADLLPPKPPASAASFMKQLAETRCLYELVEKHRYRIRERPHTTAAKSARVIPAAGESWISVGDAALSFDPLSLQGILTALYTGVRGGEAVTSALGGKPAKLIEYERRLDEIWRSYLENRDQCYALESRWPDQPFWRRRGKSLSRSSAEME